MSRSKRLKKLFRDEKKRLTKAFQTHVRFHPLLLRLANLRVTRKLKATYGAGFAVPPIHTVIARGDRMYKKRKPEGYFEVGYMALRCVHTALADAGKTEVGSILDLPCGHGRVLRTLRAAFPRATVVACDLERDGVDFCARELGATPLHSLENPAEIQIPQPFDLIWVGSLMTHLDAPRWPDFLTFFSRALAPGGVLIFTTHGLRIQEMMQNKEYGFGLDPAAIETLLADYGRTEFGYANYPKDGNYGVSLSTRDWVTRRVAETPGLKLLTYTPTGWMTQDTVVCMKSGGSPTG